MKSYAELLDDRRRTGFKPPTGRDRCPACGHHTPTQDHAENCPREGR